jgi:hypothetical protein
MCFVLTLLGVLPLPQALLRAGCQGISAVYLWATCGALCGCELPVLLSIVPGLMSELL